MNAAIYCRVSTEAQEAEGTSLLTQHESCLKYCLSKGYTVTHQFSESKSGLSLDRPKLDELRDLIRKRAIDVLVVHALDRLSRDPSHGVILIDEREKHNVKLEAVTETVEDSELGKLISYLRGFASKIEAQKIKERTSRGRKARAKEGYMSVGGFSRCYGYDYVNRIGKQAGYRIINEVEAGVVRDIFKWYVQDRISTYEIAERLKASGLPTKRSGMWRGCIVRRILGNIGYTGKTYAFCTDSKGRQYSRDRADWIELPSPQIIPVEIFEAAQKMRAVNIAASPRRMTRQYLLRGHIRCKQCGHAYYGHAPPTWRNGKRVPVRRYYCSGKLADAATGCRNKSWQADKLEAMVWGQLEKIICNPETALAEIQKQNESANMLDSYLDELKQIERSLKNLDKSQEQLLRQSLMGFPEGVIITENKRINAERERLKGLREQTEANIKASREAESNMPKLLEFLKIVQGKLENLDFEKKRLILEALGITLWLDGNTVQIKGTIDASIVTTPSCLCSRNIQSLPFSLKL